MDLRTVGDQPLRARGPLTLPVVQRHDEMVPAARRCNVEQAAHLGLVVRGFRRSQVAVVTQHELAVTAPAPRVDPDAPGGMIREVGRVLIRIRRSAQAGQNHDRELEALGGVDRHDPHGVLVVIDARALVVDDHSRRLPLQPRHERPQTLGPGAFEGPRLFDQEAGAAKGVAVPLIDRSHFDHSALPDELLDEAGQRRLVPASVVAAQDAKSLGDRSIPAVEVAAQVVEAPAIVRREGCEVDVGAGERRAAQRTGHRHLVRRVVDRRQAVDDVPHLLRPVDQAATLDPVGHLRVGKLPLQRREQDAARDQHRDVAVRSVSHRPVSVLHLPLL